MREVIAIIKLFLRLDEEAKNVVVSIRNIRCELMNVDKDFRYLALSKFLEFGNQDQRTSLY